MSQLGERKGAKNGHTLGNDIMLDKCHISAFVACKDILKHTLNRKLIEHRTRTMLNLFGIVKYTLVRSVI